MTDIQMNPLPTVGEDWKTARGFTVRIRSIDQNTIGAEYMDIRCGGHIPVQFDLAGAKGGVRPDRLVDRVK